MTKEKERDEYITLQERAAFFSEPGVDQLFAMCLVLAEELAVTNERLDTIKQVLIDRGVFAAEAIDRYRPTPDVERERTRRHSEFARRLLRVIDDEYRRLEVGRKGAEREGGEDRGD